MRKPLYKILVNEVEPVVLLSSKLQVGVNDYC